jgi:DNA-binding CsgD family transcriptional regulator
MVAGSRQLEAARTPAPGGVLPLASGRGARRGQRVTHRGGRAAPGGARRRGPDRAGPLLRELKLLAQRARLDLAPAQAAVSAGKAGLEEVLGLTSREGEVLDLVARGYTNRQIAATLVISVKTVSVHVSHILRKLGAPNRLEAAAIVHRLAPPPTGQP